MLPRPSLAPSLHRTRPALDAPLAVPALAYRQGPVALFSPEPTSAWSRAIPRGAAAVLLFAAITFSARLTCQKAASSRPSC